MSLANRDLAYQQAKRMLVETGRCHKPEWEQWLRGVSKHAPGGATPAPRAEAGKQGAPGAPRKPQGISKANVPSAAPRLPTSKQIDFGSPGNSLSEQEMGALDAPISQSTPGCSEPDKGEWSSFELSGVESPPDAWASLMWAASVETYTGAEDAAIRPSAPAPSSSSGEGRTHRLTKTKTVDSCGHQRVLRNAEYTRSRHNPPPPTPFLFKE